jgi:hypothetical protein
MPAGIPRCAPGALAFLTAAVGKAADDPASLDRLHDIVLRPPISWWPPALGWHVVAAIALWLAAVGVVRAVSRHRANAYRRAALRELAALERTNRWEELPALLKRVALAAYPREEVASLSGDAWLRFLDRTAGTPGFGRVAGEHLLQLAYAGAEGATGLDSRVLVASVSRWITRHSEHPPRCPET